MTYDTQDFKLPRLYADTSFNDKLSGAEYIELTDANAHYLRNVLRKNVGDQIRLFNGRDGEYTARIKTLTKKSASAELMTQTKTQAPHARRVHLIFSPIKKYRQDIMIEKAVELGATDLHPAFMDRTQGKHFKKPRAQSQIIDAAEQCERLDIPTLHDDAPLAQVIKSWDKKTPLYWANERGQDTPLSAVPLTGDVAFLIGPEGGFSDNESAFLSAQKNVTPITLGDTIYRVETAAMLCLAKALG